MAVRRLLETSRLDAFCFWSQAHIRFLCGFTGSDGVLVVLPQRSVFLTDGRYRTQAGSQVKTAEVSIYSTKLEAVAALLEENGCRRVGIEGDAMTVAALDKLRSKAPSVDDWPVFTDDLAPLRRVKSADELRIIEEAARLNAEAFEALLPYIRPGVTERDVALQLEFELKRRGADEKAFDFIVASGERGALPHGIASERELRSGELVTIDFGVRRGGYHSDETVTLALGEVDSKLREIYDTVLAAHDLALEAVRPGVSLQELDALARDLIAERGYGEYFGHGLGHGVGLEVHEAPTVSSRSKEVAEEGMVFTVEPGIYIPGLGGVRIEDMVVVTSSGARTLTRIPKDFRVL